MAESSEQQAPWKLWPLVAVFLVISGYIQLIPKLESTRPMGEKAGPEKAGPVHAVRARLWEDPLAAVRAGVAALPQEKPPDNAPWLRLLGGALKWPERSNQSEVDRDRQSIENSLQGSLDGLKSSKKLGCDTRIVVFLAMIDGGPYPEDLEVRRRTRYAVLSALDAEGFDPHDADHLGYFALRQGRAEEPMYVPFEWYEPEEDTSHRLVLLLWVNESEIHSRYIDWLSKCSRKLKDVLAKQNCGSVNFKVLGPSNSDVLAGMRNEADNREKLIEGFYSSQSTAELARGKAKNKGIRENLSSDVIGGIPINFLIGTDRDLLVAMQRELHLRDCCTGNPSNPIAVIAERDTLYGRDILQVTSKVFPTCRLCNASSKDGVHQFTYFQGIDGRLPGDKEIELSQDKKDQDSTIWKEPLPGRRGTAIPAVGYPRIDYLRRTVDDLKRENSNWKAIGVLGSDVYDKILLIRVLRYYFPAAILFTTDLDARLLDPAEYPSTHNLLIASHYGLELRNELQREVPPFRSVYQTSEFVATIKAIRDARESDLRNVTENSDALTLHSNANPQELTINSVPIVFEVGRTGPYPLEFRGVNGDPVRLEHTVHPRFFARSLWPFSRVEWQKAVFLLAAVAVGLGLLVVLYNWYRGPASSSGSWKPLLGWIAGIVVLWTCAESVAIVFGFSVVAGFHGYWLSESVVLLAVLFILVCFSHQSLKAAKGDFTFWLIWIVGVGIVSAGLLTLAVQDSLKSEGEPLQFLGGISVWPSEFLRLFALFFAVGAIVHGIRHIENSESDAKNSFTNESSALALGHEGIQSWPRWGRILIMGVCFLVFGTLLSLLLGKPDRPVRGEFSSATDYVLVYFSVIAFVALLFFVVDATLRIERSVRTSLTLDTDQWHADQLKAWAPIREFSTKGARPAAASCVLGVRLTAQLTSDVGPLIYYPAIVLVLLFLSRNRAFDNWDWPPALVIIFTVGSLAVIACGLSLRLTADRTRRKALKALESWLSEAREAAGDKADDPATKAVQAAMTDVKDANEGAYSSVYDNPVIRAVLIPLAGVAGLLPLIGNLLGIDL
jgi:hypothetical protein